MPGPESRGRKARFLIAPLLIAGGGSPSDCQASCGKPDHKAQGPPPNGTETKQTCRYTAGFCRTICDPERGQRNRRAVGSDAANPDPSAAPNRIRRGICDNRTAHTECGETARENPAAPTILSHARRHGPFRESPGL